MDFPNDLAQDVAVTGLPKAPGWYTADISQAWDFATPSGGVLMSVALRAMRAELGDSGLRPLSANTLFMSPVPAGPMAIRVEVLRRGGAAAQLRAGLSSTRLPGPGLEVSATFARDRDGPDFCEARRPQVPAPDELPDWHSLRGTDDPGEMPAFFRNLDVRHALGPQWWATDFEPAAAHIARWMRYLVPQQLADATLDPLAIPPIADTMPPAVRARLGPSGSLSAPSLDLTVHFLTDTTAEWLLFDVHANHARAGYASAFVNIWDDDRLVAFATQTMLLRAQ